MMKKEPKKHGNEWTSNDVSQLKKLAKGNTPTPLIAFKLQRTEGAVRNKASEINLTLKPTNKSPYDRKVANKKKKK